MKSPHNIHSRSRSSSGAFTLIELLLVITIIAILAALTISGMSYAQQASARNRSLAGLTAIKSGLEAYKEKFGEYPAPKSPTETSSFGGNKTMVSGGATMLYQALTGDGSDAINLGSTASSQPSDGKIEGDEIQSKVVGELPKTMVYRYQNGAAFMLIDGFGRPFQYQKGDTTSTINSTSYDLWSYGTTQDAAINASLPSLEEKKNKSATWIKNW